jgi:predicted amidohydrolase YtcJ
MVLKNREVRKTVRIFAILGFLGFVALGLSCSSAVDKELADLIFYNGRIYTVDPQLPWAEAVAVKGNRILAVGTSQEMLEHKGEDTRVEDLQGRLMLPGFIDSHTHFLNGGFALTSILLRDAGSKEEFIARIAQKARELEPGEWILNGDWDQTQFDPPELPKKEWIDAVTPDNPVCVNRLDGHMVFVNSLALKLAGITRETAVPQGGVMVLDPATGDPTGILKDDAMDLVSRHIPEPSPAEKKRAAQRALTHAASLGVTSIHEMAYLDNFQVYAELLEENKLTSRLVVYIPISEVDRFPHQTSTGSPELLKIGGLKGFVDGSLGSFTALFFDPYSDNPQKSGIMVSDMYPKGIMEERIRKADTAGLQVAIHAIGDKANHIILDIFESVMKAGAVRDRRWRVEHAQHLTEEDIARFGKLQVLASVQPYHAIDDGRWAEVKIGAERAITTYAFRSLQEAGSVLACGSDWTVAPLDPIGGIYAAVTRRTLDDRNPEGWIPAEKISLEDAIQGYTLNGAYAEFSETEKGSIEAGKLADLVVLDRNLFEIPPEEIIAAKVWMTVFNGEILYRQ